MRIVLFVGAIFHIMRPALGVCFSLVGSIEPFVNLPGTGLPLNKNEDGSNDTDHPPHVHGFSFNHHGPASDLPSTVFLENRSRRLLHRSRYAVRSCAWRRDPRCSVLGHQ